MANGKLPLLTENTGSQFSVRSSQLTGFTVIMAD